MCLLFVSIDGDCVPGPVVGRTIVGRLDLLQDLVLDFVLVALDDASVVGALGQEAAATDQQRQADEEDDLSDLLGHAELARDPQSGGGDHEKNVRTAATTRTSAIPTIETMQPMAFVMLCSAVGSLMRSSFVLGASCAVSAGTARREGSDPEAR